MSEKTTGDQFDQIEVSRNLSQLIRSNAPQYWRYMKNQAELHDLRHYLTFGGMIAGDPHMGNFGVLPLRTVGGARQMKFVNIDFDDAGRGPFVLDFIRCVISSKAASGTVKKRCLEEAYLKGLTSKEVAPPKKVKDLLEMNVSDYDDMVANYAEKEFLNGGFRV